MAQGNNFRAAIFAEGWSNTKVYQCRFDRFGLISLRTGGCSIQGWAPDAWGEIAACVAKGESFVFETTLAGLSYLKQIKEWKILVYQVSLYFLTLPSVEAAIDRVAERVKQGGHNIPQDVIRRRFTSGKRNFDTHYKFVVDSWACYDNAGPEPILLEWSERT